MRIPAFAIAAAFSGGILLGRGWQLSPRVLEISFPCIRSLLIAAFIFAWPKRVSTAAIFSLVGWVWLGNELRLPRMLATVLLLAALFAYIAVVEQRAPVLRAGLMTGIVVLAGFSYRRLEILNSAVPCLAGGEAVGSL